MDARIAGVFVLVLLFLGNPTSAGVFFSFVATLSICHRIGEDCAEYKFNYTHYDFMAVLRACT
jgi:hypothetical protein